MILYFKHIIHIDDFPLNGHPPSTMFGCCRRLECQRRVNGKVVQRRQSKFRHLDTKPFMNLYKTLVRPKVEYCMTVAQLVFKKDKEKIERVQR